MNQATSDERLGPIDYLAVEFVDGGFTEDDFALLLEAVNSRTVRLLDLEFVKKDPNGEVRKATRRIWPEERDESDQESRPGCAGKFCTRPRAAATAATRGGRRAVGSAQRSNTSLGTPWGNEH